MIEALGLFEEAVEERHVVEGGEGEGAGSRSGHRSLNVRAQGLGYARVGVEVENSMHDGCGTCVDGSHAQEESLAEQNTRVAVGALGSVEHPLEEVGFVISMWGYPSCQERKKMFRGGF